MTPSDFRAALGRLGLTQAGAARVVGVDARTVRRWASGERAVPVPVQRLLAACERYPALARGHVTVAAWSGTVSKLFMVTAILRDTERRVDLFSIVARDATDAVMDAFLVIDKMLLMRIIPSTISARAIGP